MTAAVDAGPLVYVIAGEPSGDMLGGALMESLKALTGGTVRFAGVGGLAMRAQGLESLFPMEDLAVMGIVEVLPRLPALLARIRETAADVAARRPDVLVTIDSPDFNFRVARKVRRLAPDVPLVHYVAPTVWAWRPERARQVAGFLDHVLCLFPFEPPYFAREGLAATFVGHPIAARPPLPAADKARWALGLEGDRPVLAVLPGSRASEVSRMMPVFAGTVRQLLAGGWRGTVVIPTLDKVRAVVEREAAGLACRTLVTTSSDEKWTALAAADAALAASGTVVLELAAAGTPTVVAYRVSPISAAVGRRLIKVAHVGLVNILMNREVMPEYLQEACTAERLAPAVRGLLTDAAARDAQKQALAEAMAMLRPPDGTPADAAARVVLDTIKART